MPGLAGEKPAEHLCEKGHASHVAAYNYRRLASQTMVHLLMQFLELKDRYRLQYKTSQLKFVILYTAHNKQDNVKQCQNAAVFEVKSLPT